MSRSVSRPTNATTVAYRDVSEIEESYEWEWFIEDFQDRCRECWPSLEQCDKWLDREDHAVLTNDHCYIGISEYCGLAALWIVPIDDNDHPELSAHWCEQISDKFLREFGDLRHVATFSNGEAIFERA